MEKTDKFNDFVAGEEPYNVYALDDAGIQGELLDSYPNYDVRTRSWYIGAKEKGQPIWYDAYAFFGRPDILALPHAHPLYDETGNLLGVLATEIVLAEISEFLKTLEIGETGEVFIIEKSGLMIATSTAQQLAYLDKNSQESVRLHAIESNNPLIKASAEHLTTVLKDLNQIENNQVLEWKLDGKRHFLQVLPFQDEQGIDWLIVVTLPESDFIAQIKANTRTTIWLCLGTLILSVVVSSFTSKWIAAPILRLSQASEAIAEGLAMLAGDGEAMEVSPLLNVVRMENRAALEQSRYTNYMYLFLPIIELMGRGRGRRGRKRTCASGHGCHR